MAFSKEIIKIKGSKSIINRVLLICTFLDKPILMHNFSRCTDVETFVENLKKYKFVFDYQADSLFIHPAQIGSAKLFIKDAGTTFRFLLTRLALANNCNNIISASEQLQSRPHGKLIDAINELGGNITKKYPLEIVGKDILGGKISISGDISSQFISSILLSAPYFQNGLILEIINDIVSKRYIELTLEIMQDFGVKSFWKKNIITIPAGQKYINRKSYTIEPDYSTVCYFWALATISNIPIVTKGNPTQSLQADAGFIKVLKEVGANIIIENSVTSISSSQINGISINMKNMPDQVPTLAVIALFAKSSIYISNISHLKYKESDRISTLIEELGKITKIVYKNGILQIDPIKTFPKRKIILKTYNDHRLIMAFTILGIVIKNIELDSIKAITKSAPEFFEILNTIKKKSINLT